MKKKSVTDKIIECVLTPLSWLYGAGVWVRNKMFDFGFFREEMFDVPVVGVGNITVGGTGKTPHVEYLIKNLSSKYNLAVLSRGYKRKTKGFIEANHKSTPDQIGDEPMQIYAKYGMMVKVAVCESRREGITELLKAYPDLQLIILDDSFQHRWVKPKVSILLTDHDRPYYHDKLLPLGRLRESPHSVLRADMVIMTKCPDNMMPHDYRQVIHDLDLLKYQKIYFSRYEYGQLKPVFEDDSPYHASLGQLSADDSVFLLTGIARPRYFVRHFRTYPFKVKVAHYPDHHDFSRKDIDDIRARYDSMKGYRKIIITTEKDAVRLACNPYYPRELKPFTFYLPIEVVIDPGVEHHDFINDLVGLIESSNSL
ncbi:MAG: tetraacyldisaccharide 4'-kinase [Muribaculum sp.]|nr:tetraacyldisaccharide 4'-kinase [Muribaculum sp.]